MKKKITLSTIGAIAGILVMILTLVEKTEALIARVASRNPKDPITQYSLDKHMNMQEPKQEQARKQ